MHARSPRCRSRRRSATSAASASTARTEAWRIARARLPCGAATGRTQSSRSGTDLKRLLTLFGDPPEERVSQLREFRPWPTAFVARARRGPHFQHRGRDARQRHQRRRGPADSPLRPRAAQFNAEGSRLRASVLLHRLARRALVPRPRACARPLGAEQLFAQAFQLAEVLVPMRTGKIDPVRAQAP